MPTTTYRNAAGKRLPSVTTVLGCMGFNKRILQHWAWKQGLEGLDFRQTMQTAASAGTLAHLMVEQDLRGDFPDLTGYDQDIIDLAVEAFGGWLRWKETSRFEVLALEQHLVDDELGFGGTFDQVMVMGRPSICDLKTGKSVYGETWAQLAAYKHLWELHNPEVALDGGGYVLRIDKVDGGFSHHHKPKLDRYWDLFRAALELFKIGKELKV